jgi:hypothetical protein
MTTERRIPVQPITTDPHAGLDENAILAYQADYRDGGRKKLPGEASDPIEYRLGFGVRHAASFHGRQPGCFLGQGFHEHYA